jgi:hypothetical protein
VDFDNTYSAFVNGLWWDSKQLIVVKKAYDSGQKTATF